MVNSLLISSIRFVSKLAILWRRGDVAQSLISYFAAASLHMLPWRRRSGSEQIDQRDEAPRELIKRPPTETESDVIEFKWTSIPCCTRTTQSVTWSDWVGADRWWFQLSLKCAVEPRDWQFPGLLLDTRLISLYHSSRINMIYDIQLPS